MMSSYFVKYIFEIIGLDISLNFDWEISLAYITLGDFIHLIPSLSQKKINFEMCIAQSNKIIFFMWKDKHFLYSIKKYYGLIIFSPLK